MSQIRKRSLKATGWIYIGFLIGAVNTWFFAQKGWFGTDQYGLTRILLEIGQLCFAFSLLGSTSFIFKFFPYYEDNLKPKDNDLLGLALLVSLCGFVIVTAAAYFFEPLIIRKFNGKSPMLVEYFYWALPLGFFMLLYQLLEAYAYGFQKGVFTNFLKETVLRLYTFILIIAKVFQLIDFKTFICLFSLQFAIIVIILAVHLYRANQLWITFKISRVTKKFRKKIIAILAFTMMVIIVNAIRQTIDGLVLAARKDLINVGVFGFAVYITSILQAPLRSMTAVTIPILSRFWKEKKLADINRIYKRSSINLLSFSLFAFFLVWLNYEQAISFFGMNDDFLSGRWVFFLLGIVTIIELGTGINGQIIGTSTFWRFELWTSLLLTSLIIPLSYWLTVEYGLVGPAIANVVSFSVYNFTRFVFLWKRFDMQPFTLKTLEVILISVALYFVTYFLFDGLQGLSGLFVRTAVFGGLFIVTIYFRNITPDLKPLVEVAMRKLKIRRRTEK